MKNKILIGLTILFCSCVQKEYHYPSFPLSEPTPLGSVQEMVSETEFGFRFPMSIVEKRLVPNAFWPITMVVRYDSLLRPTETLMTAGEHSYNGRVIEYDNNVSVISPFSYHIQGDTNWLAGRERLLLDAKWKMLSIRDLDHNECLKDSIIRDCSGRVVEQLHYDNGVLATHYKYLYREDGLLAECVSGIDSSVVYRMKYRRGKAIKVFDRGRDFIYQYDTLGRLIAVNDSIGKSTFSDFDEFGNWQKKVCNMRQGVTSTTTRKIIYF